jgi:hypothetical protein
MEEFGQRATMTTITVKAAWDPEATVWYIEHSNLPGLHIEAGTPLELYDKLPGAIEDLQWTRGAARWLRPLIDSDELEVGACARASNLGLYIL